LPKFSSKANWLYTAQFSCVDVQPAHIKAFKNISQCKRKEFDIFAKAIK
jgi:hypothetical protein